MERKRLLLKKLRNKNAFQWDAYCPLVARISQDALLPGGVPAQGGVPARKGRCTCLGGSTCPGGIYLLGVPARGVYLPRGVWGCIYPGGYLPGGCVYMPRWCVPAWGVCTCLVVYLPKGTYLPRGAYRPGTPPCEQND